MRLEQRRVGSSDLRVSEVGLSVRGRDERSAEVLRHARSAGIDLFHLETGGDLPWLAECLGPAPVTVLAGTQAPPIGGRFVKGAPDAHLTVLSCSSLTESPGALGPYRVLGAWEIGAPAPDGAANRLDLVKKVLDDRTTQALSLTYSMQEQGGGLTVTKDAAKAGAGVFALDVARLPAGRFDFLVKPKRTLLQAAILFVLANEYVTSAVVEVESLAQLREAAAVPDAEPLTISELERVIEMYIHRNDDGLCR